MWRTWIGFMWNLQYYYRPKHSVSNYYPIKQSQKARALKHYYSEFPSTINIKKITLKPNQLNFHPQLLSSLTLTRPSVWKNLNWLRCNLSNQFNTLTRWLYNICIFVLEWRARMARDDQQIWDVMKSKCEMWWTADMGCDEQQRKDVMRSRYWMW